MEGEGKGGIRGGYSTCHWLKNLDGDEQAHPSDLANVRASQPSGTVAFSHHNLAGEETGAGFHRSPLRNPHPPYLVSTELVWHLRQSWAFQEMG